MTVYDSLRGEKKELRRLRSGPLRLFVCGPTVYDYPHLGHARTYLFFDILVRWLRHRKIPVFYLQNITDIDDKIIESGADRRFFEKAYLADMAALGIETVDRYARASDFIAASKNQIRRLWEKGFAYQTNSGVYFEVKKFKAYGRLSRQNLAELRPGYRIEPDPEKKDPLDFALWKKSESESRNLKFDIRYPSPWGPGRPGWHIEDTAITEKFFGLHYELHGGGVDLKFPHHEAEIAQAEALSGEKPFVKIWLHAGLLLVNGEKMSKSLGNFITVRDFLKKHSADVLRFLVLFHHYRSPLNYTESLAGQAENALANINKFLSTLVSEQRQPIDLLVRKAEKKLTAALADDFNTPKALAALFDFMARAPKTEKAQKWLAQKLQIFGFELSWRRPSREVKKMLLERERYRQKKDFASADKLRLTIRKLGFEIED